MTHRFLPVDGSRSELDRVIRDRYRAGDIGAQDALHLFDELLQQAGPSSVSSINRLLTVVARDGPALAVSLFNRIARAGSKKVAPDISTYIILLGCCCRAGRLDLGFASYGHVIKMGWRVDAIVFTPMLKGLCAEKRTSDAIDIALRRMPELGCTPDVFSYTIQYFFTE